MACPSDWEVPSTRALARAAEHPRGGSIAESLSSPHTPSPQDGWSTGYSRAARAHVALIVLVEKGSDGRAASSAEDGRAASSAEECSSSHSPQQASHSAELASEESGNLSKYLEGLR